MATRVLRDDAAIPAGPAAVGLVAWRHGGVVRVTVIAKATFAFAEDAAMPRVDPQPLFRAEVHHGDNPARSTRYAVDQAPYLDRADVLFTGNAHVQAGAPAAMMPVRLGLFDGARALLDKTLIVRHGGVAARVPLLYERAYGGPGWADNPYGVGAVTGSGEPDVVDPVGAKRLAGFGPIGEGWSARRRLAGKLPRGVKEGEVLEIPDGFDWAYFQTAPADQRIDFLRGDEWIVMDGLHPERPLARMRLPGARGVARVYGLSPHGVAEGQPLSLHADTLRIDGDDQRCMVTFRGVFPVADEAALGAVRVVAGVEIAGEPIPWPAPAELGGARPSAAGRGAAPAPMFEGTLTLGDASLRDVAQRRAMPFRSGQAPDSVVRAAPASAPQAPSLHTVDLPGDRAVVAPLPFQPPASAAPPRWAPAPREAAPGEATMAFDGGPPADPLPFTAPRPYAEPPALVPMAPMPPAEPAVVVAPASEPVVEAAPPPPPPPPAAAEITTPAASPWAPPPDAPPPAPRAPKAPPPKPQAPPAEALQKGLYGRFSGR